MTSAGVSSSKTTTASTTRSAASELGPLGLGQHRTGGPLVGPHRAVGVDGDDEHVALGPRRREVVDVPGMHEVEHAVGEDDDLAGARCADSAQAAAPSSVSTGDGGRAAIVDQVPRYTRGVMLDAVREHPAVGRSVDADVLGARLHAERVEQAVIVVRIAVAPVDGDVELVGALRSGRASR